MNFLIFFVLINPPNPLRQGGIRGFKRNAVILKLVAFIRLIQLIN